MIEWSSYQKAIFEAYEETKKNIIIGATAGASKTTTLIECLKRTPPKKKVLFVAFNKSIAEELKTKVPSFVECSTLHSKGLKVLFSNFRVKMKLEENKTFKMGLKILDTSELKPKESIRYLFELQTIWDQLRMKVSKDYVIDIPFICIEKDIEFRDRILEDIHCIESEWKKRVKKIQRGEFEMDFTDMLYLPNLLISPEDFPKYDVVFLDEAQDLCFLQRNLVLSMISSRGRLISVGDKNQSIYSFMSADLDVYDSIVERPNTLNLPLSISYRCSKAVVKEAQKVFPESIEAWSEAKEGSVLPGELDTAEIGDFVLCRNNKPLVETFIHLLKLKKPAVIKGKDIGENLLLILDKIAESKDLDSLLEQKLADLQQKGIPPHIAVNTDTYITLEEKVSILKVLFKEWPTVEELTSQMGRIFSEDIKGKVILSTIHKSKGLEADNVYFLNQELIPSDRAKTEKAKYAEECLRFVAITRARKNLIYCNI